MTPLQTDRRQLLLAAMGACVAVPGLASTFPLEGKPVRLLVGYPAGGGTDAQARLMALYLAPRLGVPVVVENRPGAGTMMAANELIRSAPDGHTLMYTPISTVAQLPHTMQAVKYDGQRDFTPVVQCALGPVVLVVHTSIPAKNAQELAAYAKAHPGELNYVSQGVGTSAHIFGQMLARQLNVQMVHVPYKGASEVAKDFVAGRVHLQFASSSGAAALVKSGAARMLGVVAPQRSGLFPDVPTMAEQGVKDMDLDTALGLIGPAGMAPATVANLSQAMRDVLAIPKVQEDFRAGGVEPQWQDAQEFARVIRFTSDGWARMLQQVGYRKE